MARRSLACAALLLALTACGSDDEVEGPGPPATGPYRADVDWDAYEPGLQRRIDSLESDQDCEGLVSAVDAVPDSQGSQGGDRRLRRYLNEAMDAADCHSYS